MRAPDARSEPPVPLPGSSRESVPAAALASSSCTVAFPAPNERPRSAGDRGILSRVNRELLVSTLRSAFVGKAGQGVVAAYLFGSVARGDDRPDSDIDVGVILAAGRPKSLNECPLEVLDALERAVSRPIDLVVLNGASADFIHRVLRDGVLLHESDRAARVEFEVQARNEYFDILPMLERHRRIVLDSV